MIRPKAPIVVQVELTNNCNHKCVHCYNFWRDDEYVPEQVSKDDVVRLKDMALKLIEGDIFYVTLSGGEPLLLKEDDLEEIIRTYKTSNVDVGLNSNITLANESHCRILNQYGVTVLTSMVGCDESEFDEVTRTRGSFRRFIEKAKLLASNGVYLSANMVVDKKRVHNVYETGKFAATLGFRGFNATRLSPSNSSVIKAYENIVLNNREITDMLDQLLAVKTEFGLKVGSLNALPYCCVPEPAKYKDIFTRSCVAGLTTAGVNVKGEVRACQHFDISYGNVLEESLQGIWKKMPVWKETYSGNTCKGCAYIDRCGGGCRENAYRLEGNMQGEDSLKKGGSGRISRKWDGKTSNVAAIHLEDNLKIRDEAFGGILFKSPSRYAFIDKFTHFFVKALYDRKVITKKDLLEIGSSIEYVNENYINVIFSSLVNNHVAKIAEV